MINKIWQQLKKIDLDIGTDRNILFICIGIAFFFWIISKLSKEYETHKHIAATYVIPENFAFSKMPPNEFIAELEGSGWDLMYEYFINGEATVLFDLSQQQIFDLNRPEIESKIKNSLSSRVKITDLDYDYVRLALEDKVRKKIPIVFQQNIQVAAGFQQEAKVSLSPDSVLITGPFSMTDTISRWGINLVKMPVLKGDFEQISTLKRSNKREISITPKEVVLTVPIEQLTEKKVFVPIAIKNPPEDSLNIFPNKIQISCTVGLSEYNSLQPSDFIIEVDLKNISNQPESNTIPISLVQYPAYVEAINFSPKAVEFFIIK